LIMATTGQVATKMRYAASIKTVNVTMAMTLCLL